MGIKKGEEYDKRMETYQLHTADDDQKLPEQKDETEQDSGCHEP